MDFSKYYIIKHNSDKFEPETIVHFENCTYSGNCYLISDLNNTYNREWIMYYDLYPVDINKVYNNYKWYYNEKFHKIANTFINMHMNS